MATGAALFTEISAWGFADFAAGGSGSAYRLDPTRIAAQIVTRIGFLAAGVIILKGLSIKGLTTAASLWVTAAIGLGAGAGAYLLAIEGTVITLASLWPMRLLVRRIHRRGARTVTLRFEIENRAKMAEAIARIQRAGGELVSCESRARSEGCWEVDLELRVPPSIRTPELASSLEDLREVTSIAWEEMP